MESDHTACSILEGASRIGARKHGPRTSAKAERGGLDGSGLDHGAMKVQNGIPFLTFRVDPSCSLMGSGSSTRGEGPINGADEGGEGSQCDAVSLRLVLELFVVGEGLHSSLQRDNAEIGRAHV